MGAYESGKYRNIFKEIGKTDAEIENKIKEAVQVFFYDEEERIYNRIDQVIQSALISANSTHIVLSF